MQKLKCEKLLKRWNKKHIGILIEKNRVLFWQRRGVLVRFPMPGLDAVLHMNRIVC